MPNVKISSQDEWTIGKRYLLSYNVEPGFFANQTIRQSQMDAVLRSFREERKGQLTLERASIDEVKRTIKIQVLATGESSPILIIAIGLITLAAIYQVRMTFVEVEEVISAFGGSIGGTSIAFGGLGLVLIGGFALFLFANQKGLLKVA